MLAALSPAAGALFSFQSAECASDTLFVFSIALLSLDHKVRIGSYFWERQRHSLAMAFLEHLRVLYEADAGTQRNF